MQIFAIDPGNLQSGYAIIEATKEAVQRITASGKMENAQLMELLEQTAGIDLLAIEMVAHYGKGMAAGATTFDTCVWIGRFSEAARRVHGLAAHYIYRREEKLNLLGSATGKDSDLRIALVDRYAPGQPNHGKGHKARPGFFYGVKSDAWQAFAVGVTAHDKLVRGITI